METANNIREIKDISLAPEFCGLILVLAVLGATYDLSKSLRSACLSLADENSRLKLEQHSGIVYDPKAQLGIPKKAEELIS